MHKKMGKLSIFLYSAISGLHLKIVSDSSEMHSLMCELHVVKYMSVQYYKMDVECIVHKL